MKIVWTCLAFACLGACSSLPSLPAMPAISFPSLPGFSTAPARAEAAPSAAATSAEPTTRERVAKAAELLSAGKESDARAELQAALVASPRDATAQAFLRQIETDPVVLLGEASQPYVVQAGDTMSGLAGRFLNDSLMFYALSRYNGLSSPNALAVGRTLKIPLTAKAPATSATLTTLPEPAAAAKAIDPAKANAIRLQALQLLNTGEVLRAVALLREAVSLDGTDPAIRKDLERAQRIQDALNGG